MRRLTLKPRREGPVRGGHPWIFSGAIAAGLEGVEPGEPVHVHAAGGRFLAGGYVNPRTPIAVRVLTLEAEAIDAALVRRRLDEALALRQRPRYGNSVRGPMPQRPSASPAASAGTSPPSAHTTPSPVITTRRGTRLR